MLSPYSTQAQSLPLGIYQHYKGQQYRVIGVGRLTETLEECVIYQALYGDHDFWIRPLSMFLETVNVEGKTVARFEKI